MTWKCRLDPQTKLEKSNSNISGVSSSFLYWFHQDFFLNISPHTFLSIFFIILIVPFENIVTCYYMGFPFLRGGFHGFFLRNIFTHPGDSNCARDDESRCLGPFQDKPSHIWGDRVTKILYLHSRLWRIHPEKGKFQDFYLENQTLWTYTNTVILNHFPISLQL